MKFLILLSLISTSMYANQPILANNDIISSSKLEVNVDGVELWEFPLNQRAQIESDFNFRCLNDIPERQNAHYTELAHASSVFSFNDIKTNHEVIKKYLRGLGTQLLCRNSIEASEDSKIKFGTIYSQIFSDRRGTYELCKHKIAQIDATAIQNDVLTRRAYFSYARDRNGNVFYPKCQTLQIIVKVKN